ncbi:hypothetical protein [Oceanobacter sp. 4_MG-2023]|uniref:hypothetical protein n=1 Tax=Oceanobacter sp. 4_MG-2023 TaxID=3062623 RepID=UPI002733B4EE|nr:hypothetical protein [Oceanobacter sp. 4_MG-2023]MDP2546210.1 hypothetical protein [Oceanobacter sp. 4_MG-2023]
MPYIQMTIIRSLYSAEKVSLNTILSSGIQQGNGFEQNIQVPPEQRQIDNCRGALILMWLATGQPPTTNNQQPTTNN